MRYAGLPFVMVDADKNCITGISDVKPSDVSQGCQAQNFRSNDLDKWVLLRYGNPFVDVAKTVFIEDLPTVNIYCFGHSIKIQNEKPLECPPYAFTLPAHSWWRTPDHTFAGLDKTTYNFTSSLHLPEHIVPARVQDPNSTRFVESDALKKIYNLMALLEQERRNSLVLNTPIGGVSHFNRSLQHRMLQLHHHLVLATQPPNN